MDSLPWLNEDDYSFPDPAGAMKDPNGLLAAGGDLSPLRILGAYQLGIFPWYEDDQPILWWSPDPRMVLFPDELHISRSLKKTIKKGLFSVTFNQNFEGVINACAGPRDYSSGTWLTTEMIESYIELHRLGHAHSVEVWRNAELVGGIYGLSIGKIFYGESMFSHEDNASKIAFISLVEKLKEENYSLIDCQIASTHLKRFGAREISRKKFKSYLSSNVGSISKSPQFGLQ